MCFSSSCFVFFCKQKTAYVMRIRDWSSDVCSSDLLAHSEYGQLVLASLPGLSSDSARKIGEAYETLGDVLNAAEKGEASASLPKSLHHELSRANNWSNAMDRVELIEKSADKNGMDAITATSDAYRSEEHTSELQSLMRSSYA